MIFGGAMLTMVGTAAGEWPRLAFSARSAVSFAYLVLFGSMVGYSAYIYTLKHLRVSTISLSSYVNPIIAVILGVVVAGGVVRPQELRGVGGRARRRGAGARDSAESLQP